MRISYLFDPLCGWCYGAAAGLDAVRDRFGGDLHLMPTGLFIEGARLVTPEWAAFILEHDQQIAHLTGQAFSSAYREHVLGASGSRFDSTAATRALTRLAQEGESEVDWLQRFQRARFVDGVNTSDPDAIAQLMAAAGRGDASALTQALSTDAALAQATDARIGHAQRVMRASRITGVPAVVVSTPDDTFLLQGSILYGPPRRLVSAIEDLLPGAPSQEPRT